LRKDDENGLVASVGTGEAFPDRSYGGSHCR
jgi:hypothetical protein